MPELINDVDNRGRFIVRWALKCSHCGLTTTQDDPATPKGWAEGTAPAPDGRIPVRCPECMD